MKRQFIAGALGLAIAGCAHSRSDVARTPDGRGVGGPVALTPVPSIHETINRGTGDAALAQNSLRDPNDSRWSGHAPAPGAPGAPTGPQYAPAPVVAANPEAAPSSSNWSRGPQGPPASPAPSYASATPTGSMSRQPAGSPAPTATPSGPTPMPDESPARLAGQAAPPPIERQGSEGLNPSPTLDAAAAAAASTMPGMPPAPSDTAAPAPGADAIPSPGPAMAETASPSPTPGAPGQAGNSPISEVPYSLARPGGPMPEMLAQPGGPAGPSASTGAPKDAPPAADPGLPNVASGPAPGLEPVGLPPATDAAVSPSAGPAGPVAEAPKAKPAGDPLLGPNPELMPELPPLPEMTPAATTPTAPPAPKGPAAGSRPGDPPPLGPAPSGESDAPATPGAPPAPAGAPPELGMPTTDNRPAGTLGPAVVDLSVADLPPLEPVPTAGQLDGGIVRTTSATTSAPVPVRRATARRDGQIVRTSAMKPSADGETEIPVSYRQASVTAAQVGDEVITMRDLHANLSDLCKRKSIPYNDLPRDAKRELCEGLMRELINQSLLLQEAKRTIKSTKMYDQFVAEADRFWREDQIPLLLHEFGASDEYQLREKLKEHGRSFETVSLVTRRGWMAENFLHAKLRDRIKAELPELLKYYNEHLHDQEFDRPAQITWREIVVETSPRTAREQARRKIEAIYESLRRGADFAAMATAHSEGPSKVREQGGLMQTSPGSYGVAAVNQALESLPIGRVSPIIEGPSSFHIVKVEARRAAGPAPFEELQDEIRSRILEKKFQAERAAYIQKLRDETLVSTFLDEANHQASRIAR